VKNTKRIFFEVAFPDIPEPMVDVWRNLTSFLKDHECLPKKFELMQIVGHPDHLQSEQRLKLTADEVESTIIERNLNGFWVDAGRFPETGTTYSLTSGKESGRQSVLRCYADIGAKVPDDWTELIETALVRWPGIGAWQFDLRYQSWQWSTNFEDYERWHGSRPPGLRTHIRKAIPGFAPDTEMIDISLNPGRPKELLVGINFYPTAEMWLGPHFWKFAKCTREEALAADFFLEKRDTPHFLYLKSWPEPFSRPDGEQGRQQRRLWNLFFGEDCEWPPGAGPGNICDEPRFGPPELMPASE